LRSGFYIDVGANDPIVDSVTKHFSMEGWRGINVEPQVELYRKIRDDRPNDVNLNVGVSDRASTVEFMQCLSNSGLSTFCPDLAEKRARTGLEFVKRTLPVKTLAEICEEHVKGTIDFLSIDVEGFEREVVLGNDWGRWRPRVVVVEATRPERWEPLLHAAGYLSAAFDGINLYYVRAEEPELLKALKAPVNVLDDYIRRPMHEYVESIRADSAGVRAYAAQLEAELARVRAAAGCSERALAEARRSLSRNSVLGPNALKIAHRLHDLSLRHPKLARSVLRVAGLSRHRERSE
jgi:FkbM family methyltransferase